MTDLLNVPIEKNDLVLLENTVYLVVGSTGHNVKLTNAIEPYNKTFTTSKNESIINLTKYDNDNIENIIHDIDHTKFNILKEQVAEEELKNKLELSQYNKERRILLKTMNVGSIIHTKGGYDAFIYLGRLDTKEYVYLSLSYTMRNSDTALTDLLETTDAYNFTGFRLTKSKKLPDTLIVNNTVDNFIDKLKLKVSNIYESLSPERYESERLQHTIGFLNRLT